MQLLKEAVSELKLNPATIFFHYKHTKLFLAIKCFPQITQLFSLIRLLPTGYIWRDICKAVSNFNVHLFSCFRRLELQRHTKRKHNYLTYNETSVYILSQWIILLKEDTSVLLSVQTKTSITSPAGWKRSPIIFLLWNRKLGVANMGNKENHVFLHTFIKLIPDWTDDINTYTHTIPRGPEQ